MKYQWFQLSIAHDQFTPGVLVIYQGEGVRERKEIRVSKHQLPDLIRALQAIEAEFRAASGKAKIAALADDLRGES